MAAKKNILVVDDDKDIRDLIHLFLTKHDCNVVLCDNGLDAIQKVIEVKFDCIFLDIRMSGLDGVETFKRIKDQGVDARIFIMTGYKTLADELMSDSVKEQVHAIIYKPFSLKAILGYVNQ